MLLDAIDELGWTKVAPADGAFYLYADIGGFSAATATASPGVPRCSTPKAWRSPRAPISTGCRGHTAVRVSLAAGPEAVAAALIKILRFQRSLG